MNFVLMMSLMSLFAFADGDASDDKQIDAATYAQRARAVFAHVVCDNMGSMKACLDPSIKCLKDVEPSVTQCSLKINLPPTINSAAGSEIGGLLSVCSTYDFIFSLEQKHKFKDATAECSTYRREAFKFVKDWKPVPYSTYIGEIKNKIFGRSCSKEIQAALCVVADESACRQKLLRTIDHFSSILTKYINVSKSSVSAADKYFYEGFFKETVPPALKDWLSQNSTPLNTPACKTKK